MDREGGVVVYGDRFRAVAYVARRPWATVFRAVDERDGGVVALSVVGPGAAPSADFAEVLAAEAALLSGLEHPNLLPVLEVGEDQGSHFVAEEWVDGPTLAELVAARGPLPAERVAAVLDDLAAGLSTAHAAGIVHGGPAPADVWLVGGPGGPARLHGLALLRAIVLSSIEEGLPPAGDRPYLAPERLAGEPGAPAADLYGLGAVAFEALCGVPPFGREGRPEGVDPPWPSDLVEGIPEGLDDVILDLLEEQPADRHHDALELREELQPYLRRARVLTGGGVLSAQPQPQPQPEADAAGPDAAAAALVGAAAAAVLAESEHEDVLSDGGLSDDVLPDDVLPDDVLPEDGGVVEEPGAAAPEALDPTDGTVLEDELDGEDEDWDDEWEPVEAEWEPDPAVDWQPEVVTPVVDWAPEAAAGAEETDLPDEPVEAEERVEEGEDLDAEWVDVDADAGEQAAELVEDEASAEDEDDELDEGLATTGWQSAPADLDGGADESWGDEHDVVTAPPPPPPLPEVPVAADWDEDDGEADWDDEEWQEHDDWDAPAAADGTPAWVASGGAGEPPAGRLRFSPLLGAGIVAALLVVVGLGLFVVDRALNTDSEDQASDETTTTTEATTTTTAPTTTTILGFPAELPDVVGQEVLAALGIVSDAGFLPVVEERVDPAAEPRTVLEQIPPPGQVAVNSEVTLVVAAAQ